MSEFDSNTNGSYIQIERNEIAKCLLGLEGFPFNEEHLLKYNENFRRYEDCTKNFIRENSTISTNNDDISEFYNKIQIKDVRSMDLYSLSKELPIRRLSQLNLDVMETHYSKGQFNVYVISTTFKEKRVAVKLFKLQNSVQTKISLGNQAKLMYSMGQDPGFVDLYGVFMDSLPSKIKHHLKIDSLDEFGILIMEYCDHDLQKYMKSIPKPNREQLALEFCPILIQSMIRLNNKGIKHKDIKPQNILVQIKDGKPFLKIADFDVSTTYQKIQEKTMADLTNVVGTPKYAAPELRVLLQSQEKGKKMLNSNKADVYSLGITLFYVVVQPTSEIELNNIIVDDLQGRVHKLINSMVDNEHLRNVMKVLMVVDPNQRLSFRELGHNSEDSHEVTNKNYELDDIDEYWD